jgi:hypothetical protein
MTNFNDLTQDQLDAFEAEFGWEPEEKAEYVFKIHLDQYADTIEEACKSFVELELDRDFIEQFIFTDERILAMRDFYNMMNENRVPSELDEDWHECIMATVDGQLEAQANR